MATDGRLADDPGYRYAVIDNGLSIAGETIAERGQLRLVKIAEPLRLKDSLAGVFNDGWIGSMGAAGSVAADYNLFTAPAKPGTVFVTLSRKGFCGPHAPGHVEIDVGTIALGQQKDGILGRTTQRRGWTIDSCAERTFPIATPGGPFHVKVTITPPFQPNAVDPDAVRAALLRRPARHHVRACSELISGRGRRAPRGACVRTGPSRAGARGCGGRGTSCRSRPRSRG